MNIKTLITLLPFIGAGLVPMNVVAGATATATVTANIVPAVSVTMPSSIIMGQTYQGSSPDQKESISLSTLSADDASKFNIKSSGSFSYGMTVSSRVNVASQSGNKTSINNIRFPVSSDYVTSDKEHELHMVAAIDKSNKLESGSYSGQVYLTAHFD